MRKRRRTLWFSFGSVFFLCLGCLSFLPSGNATPGAGANLAGGPHGVVRSAAGFPIEGMMVQLISQKTSMRTTVYTNELGLLILHRMLDYNGRILQGPGDGDVTPEEKAEREILVKWLARVRGPGAQDPPFKVFPRPQGSATRAVITEYELPWLGVHVHDVFGDTKSDNIWFDINRSPLIGKLDPNTGKVTSWRIPGTEGKHPGAHWIQAEKDGTVWYSETWSQSLIRFNPLTEIFKKMSSGVQGNMALAPDGTIWRTAVARWLALIVKPQKSSRHSRLEISGFQTLMATSSAGMDDILEEGIATGLLMVLFSSTEKPKKSG